MKFLLWILNFSHRHRRGARRYSTGGTGRRIFYCIIITLAVIGSLAFCYYSLDLLLNQGQLGAIYAVILAVVFILASIEFCAVYSIFAFKAASSKSIQENNDEYMEPVENHKSLDIFLGIYFLCLIFVLIGVAVLIFMSFQSIAE